MKTKILPPLTVLSLLFAANVVSAQSTIAANTLTGTAPNPTQYLGSANAYDVIFKTNGLEKMRLTTTGNLRIGQSTSTPGAKLCFNDVSDATYGTGSDGITWHSPNPLSFGIYKTAGTWTSPNFQQLQLSWTTGIILNPGTLYAKSYVDIQGNGLRVSSGVVGIGTYTVAPGYLLELKGGPTIDGSIKAIDATSAFYAVELKRSAGRLGYPDIWGDGTHPLVIAAKVDGTGTTLFSGNVGIGTPFTGNTEQYKLAVNGKIGAKAIKVEITSDAWSDYVFDEKYKFKSIHELEDFIKKYKHLPNVPSAAEVEKDGIDMATMDATLLAKIEELSLYIIEQNKRIEALEQQNTCK